MSDPLGSRLNPAQLVLPALLMLSLLQMRVTGEGHRVRAGGIFVPKRCSG